MITYLHKDGREEPFEICLDAEEVRALQMLLTRTTQSKKRIPEQIEIAVNLSDQLTELEAQI